MLKILALSPWLPWPPFDGGRIRVLETLRYLAARHSVTLLTHAGPEEERTLPRELADLCEEVHFGRLSEAAGSRMARVARGLASGHPFIQSVHYSDLLATKVRALTAERAFDIVHMEYSFLARYAKAVAPGSRAKRVLATHNIETQRFQREIELSDWGFRKLALTADGYLFPNWEEKALGVFDGATAVSRPDEMWIRRRRPDLAVQLVPNGVDTSYFTSSEQRHEGPPSIVFTGVMDYPPNIDAVTWFVDAVWEQVRSRHPELQFKIVGAKPAPAVERLSAVPGVHVTGQVPDIRPYVREAAAFVVPLRSGGGTRLKILQALSMACPVISSRLGAEGLDLRDGEHLLFADDIEGFLSAIDRVLESSELSKDLGAAGRRLVLESYDWRACLSGLDKLYAELLA